MASWLATHGHEVIVLTSTEGEEQDDGYRVLRRSSPGEIARVMRSADVVHVNGLSAKGVGWALATGRRPVVTHQAYQALCPTGLAWAPGGTCGAGPRRGPCDVCLGRGSIDVGLHRGAARSARTSVFVSRHQRSRIGLPGACIYNPVDIPHIQGATPAPVSDDIIAFAGRLVREKGLDVLLRALCKVPGARLRIAGDGPLRGEWQRLAHDLELMSRVTFEGRLSSNEVRELYAESTLVCVPSVWPEPFGYAAAEAMALGRPVVGLPTGALSELLEDGRGFLAAKVSADSLAEAINLALADAAKRRSVGDAARRFSERTLAVEVLGPKYLAVYSG